MEEVVVVDSTDKQIGVLEKLEAHRLGKLHGQFLFWLSILKVNYFCKKELQINIIRLICGQIRAVATQDH